MKKILILIITIFWIWISFCCANDFSIYDYYSNLTTQPNNWRKFWHTLQFAVSWSSVYIDTFCFSWYWYYWRFADVCSDTKGGWVVVYNFDWLTTTPVFTSSISYCVDNSSNYCVDFSWLLLEPWQTMYYTLYSYNTNRTNTNYILGGWDWYPYNTDLVAVYRPVNFNWSAQYWYFYQPVQNWLSFLIEIVNYWNASYVGPWLIKYHFANPEFKVNYWNTSYTYSLDDNLSIYLKSPVIQSWTMFIYAWSTWINLYFNNTSQFYNKDKMYLKTPSWYNNFVFTPVCL